jgi:hypothetical protein
MNESPETYAAKVIALLQAIASALAQTRKPVNVVYATSQWSTNFKVIGTRARFRGVAVANKHATDAFWIWVCDGEAAGKPICAPLYVPALTTQSLSWADSPRILQNGIFLYATSTPDTNTAITTSDAFFDCAYDLEI